MGGGVGAHRKPRARERENHVGKGGEMGGKLRNSIAILGFVIGEKRKEERKQQENKRYGYLFFPH